MVIFTESLTLITQLPFQSEQGKFRLSQWLWYETAQQVWQEILSEKKNSFLFFLFLTLKKQKSLSTSF